MSSSGGKAARSASRMRYSISRRTALADDEVEMNPIDGHFWYLKYPVLQDNLDGPASIDFVTVATTRPETMLGDTAVAVNPKDPRAAALRGKKVRLPIVNRTIPIIEDEYVVLPDPDGDEKAQFSSGYLKVTPAHDPNDYEIGQRFGLDMINVMAPDGTISDKHGWREHESDLGEAEQFLGLDRDAARKAIVQWFAKHDLLADTKPYRHSVGHSYRSHVPIEPYLSDQWYVKVTDPRLAGAALIAMAADQVAPSEGPVWAKKNPQQRTESATTRSWQGKLRFTPARYAKTFQTWHENLRDWCISRQLWWGHRIPVWSKPGESDATRSLPHDRAAVQVHDGITHVCLRQDDAELIEKLQAQGFVKDEDVLDTWFSSGLWPLSTLGWPTPNDFPQEIPEGPALLDKWNPSDALVTAREIITLWVSRMVMFNLYLRDCLPFTNVFVHAMIQDGEGRKMSKSLGNGVDPLDIIHSHGSDAMRYTLASMTTNTQDVRLPVAKDPDTNRNTSDKFDIGRNFANKLWNAGRFVLANLEDDSAGRSDPDQDGSHGELGLADRWILSRLSATVAHSNQSLQHFEFSQLAQSLYDYFWRDFCDWYIEAVKPTVRQNPAQRRVLGTCLDVALRLLQPVMPFITEKLWDHLNTVMPQRGVKGLDIPADTLLVRSSWPIVDHSLTDAAAESQFALVMDVVNAIRSARTEQKVPPRQTLTISVKAEPETSKILDDQRLLVATLAQVKPERIDPDVQRPPDAALAILGQTEIYLHGLADVSAERDRLKKRLGELQKNIKILEARSANKSYMEKAPAHLVQQTRDQLADQQQEAETVKAQLDGL